MENVILVIHLILALSLIGSVLLQRSEGGGLGMGGGGGGGGVVSGRTAASALGKITWVLAIGFIITSISLTVLSAKNSSSASVIDTVGVSAPADGSPAPTLPGGDTLLPPSAGDAPLTPPAAD